MIFVDQLFLPGRGPSCFRAGCCHMWTDESTAELIAFAGRLGLKTGWLQDTGLPSEHFDLTVGRRARAVRLGAVEATSRDWVAKWRGAKR